MSRSEQQSAQRSTQRSTEQSTSHKQWEDSTLHRARERSAERPVRFTTVSDMSVPLLSTPESLDPDWNYHERLGFP
ncbi:MAG: hypothetical protein JSV80_04425, partial [Acidobacteriota bacterium]